MALAPAYVYDLLGTPLGYDEADAMQRNLAAARSQGAIPDTILLCEHPATLTLGKSSDDSELPLGREGYAALGWDVSDTDRGGRSTWHGPGQLVVYPILDLREHGKDLRRYAHDLERALVLALADIGIEADTREGPEWVGVYTPSGKIASIGIRAQGWVVRHGLALNVDCDLAAFGQFQACGLDVPFTSVSRDLGRPFTVADAREPVLRRLGEVLGLDVSSLPAAASIVTLTGGITVFASDLAASRRFYGEQLGLAVEEDEDGFWARDQGVELRVEGGARKRRLSREFYEEAGVLVRLETDTFDSFLGGIVARGIKLFGEVKDSDTGRFVGFVDPDGNLFELIETGV